MTDPYPRTNKPEEAADAVERLIPGGVPALDDDAAWAERDRQVQAALAAKREEDAAYERRKRAELLCAAGEFPKRAMDAAFSAKESEAIARVRDFTADKRTVLILAGGVGTGKTTACSWFALERGGGDPGFIRAATLERRGRYDAKLRDWLRGRSMLVIDDMGIELLDDQGVFRSLLDEVLDMFYADRKRLLITTNLHKERDAKKPNEPPQFRERYGERIASRLHETGRWQDCGAFDLRRVKPPANEERRAQ